MKKNRMVQSWDMGSCDKVFGYVMKVRLYFEKGLMGE